MLKCRTPHWYKIQTCTQKFNLLKTTSKQKIQQLFICTPFLQQSKISLERDDPFNILQKSHRATVNKEHIKRKRFYQSMANNNVFMQFYTPFCLSDWMNEWRVRCEREEWKIEKIVLFGKSLARVGKTLEILYCFRFRSKAKKCWSFFRKYEFNIKDLRDLMCGKIEIVST